MSDVLPRLTSALESRYRIVREIGMGGMATVYLAHDLRHERDVAIKVLHPDLAAALGAGRFLAEIKTTAKLQHPHILPLLDSGEADGLLYYVMPYIVGESLRDRLDKETQLAVDDSVRIAREVASALDYAHRHGVVHRDIKPENILIHEDTALVADFGIALAVSAAGGARMTQTGLSLGTPAYMAPEQAMGERSIDGRADIYALGAVTYEMLVGEAPFTGPTVQAIVARVMTESPRPVTGQRKSVPAHVNAAVLRALEKLPADRFHSAAEFSTALVTPLAEGAAAVRSEAPKQQPSMRKLSGSLLPWAIAGIAVVVAAAALARNLGAAREREGPVYLAIDFPPGVALPPLAADGLGISADGETVAFGAVLGGRIQLFLRRFGEEGSRVVPGSLDARGGVAFSRDGKWIVFNTRGKVFKVPVGGGTPTPVATSNWAHIDWIGSDAIIYTTNYNSGLVRSSGEGGDSTELTRPDRNKGELGHWWPQVLSDEDHVLFTNYTTPADKSKIEVLSLKSGKRQVVIEGGYFGRYVDGHLLFIRNESLMSVPIDPGSFKTKGTPVPINIDLDINPPNGWAAFAVSPNGTLVYETNALRNISLEWVDERGNEEPALDSASAYSEAVPSPDGKKIAVVRDGDVWIYDRQRRFFSRLTNTEQREIDLIWSPDSKDVYYGRDVPQYDIFRRATDGSRAEELVVTSAADKSAGSISPDGRYLFFEDEVVGRDNIYMKSTDLGDKSPPVLVIDGPASENTPRISPDGKWLAFQSNESGTEEIYISPYPTNRGPSRQQISDKGGFSPFWSMDGRTLYYRPTGERIAKVAFDPVSGNVGEPQDLRAVDPGNGIVPAPDGRFLRGMTKKGAERQAIKVVLNWASTLEEKK